MDAIETLAGFAVASRVEDELGLVQVGFVDGCCCVVGGRGCLSGVLCNSVHPVM